MKIQLIFMLIMFLGSWSFGQDTSQINPTASKYPRLEFRKWSGGINVPDAVAVSVDSLGRVYATQTRRRGIQDLDIRAHSLWIPDDVGLQSIAAKREFFKRKLAVGGDNAEQAKHVKDHNLDGLNDWRDLTVVSEVIYRLVDTEGDGIADEKTIFADSTGTVLTLATDDIVEAREQSVSQMPDISEVLTAREVRDLVAYLRSLR